MIFHKKSRVKSIHIVLLFSFLWAFADGLISFYLPQQFENYLGNLALFGLVYGSYSFIGIIFDGMLGYFSSKIRYFIYLLFGLILTIVLSVFALAPFSIIIILLILIVRGAYLEFIHLGLFNYVARYHNADSHGKLFGIIYLLQDLSYTLSPLVAGVILLHGKIPLYITSIGILFVAVLLTRFLQRIHVHQEKPFLTYKKKQHFHIQHEVKIITHILHVSSIVFIGICLYYVWDSFVWALLPLESQSWGITITSIVVAAFNLPLALLQSYAGVVADRYGRYITFFCGTLLAVIFTMLFGITQNIIVIVISALLSSLGFTFAYPAMLSIISSKKNENIADVAAIERTSANIGLIFGPIIGGIIAKIFSIQGSFVFLGTGIGIVIVAQIYMFLKKHSHRLFNKMHRTNSLRFLDS